MNKEYIYDVYYATSLDEWKFERQVIIDAFTLREALEIMNRNIGEINKIHRRFHCQGRNLRS